MKTLYFDCQMGAAGDMLAASLIELFEDKNKIVEELNAIGIDGVKYELEESVKCGIVGTHLNVLVNGVSESADGHEHEEHHHEHDHHSHEEEHHEHSHEAHSHEEHHHDHDHNHDEHSHEGHEHGHDHHEHEHHGHAGHHHTSLHDIEHIVKEHLNLPAKVKKDVLAVYKSIAQAEGHVHGKKINEIHFHEVGTMDAVADISAVCYLINKLHPDKIVSSAINVGSGQVRCAHGILPVPAPATAYLLKGIPSYSGNIASELCTPTGAALIKHFANEIGNMPAMCIEEIGYGMGKKDFAAANCVRAVLGTNFNSGEELNSSVKGSKSKASGKEKSENSSKAISDESVAIKADSTGQTVTELSFNVDDMTGEAVGFLMQQLFCIGVREAYSESIMMKKNRPGIKISVICDDNKKEEIISAIFKYSTTIGIRENIYKRYTLDRKIEKEMTPLGIVRVKTSTGYGVTRTKYEYDDISAIAVRNKMSIDEVMEVIEK